MLSTCKGVPVAAPEREGEVPGSERQSNGHRGAQTREERAQGPGVQEWLDGSRYEGEFVSGLKHGKGRYTLRNGEYYEGSFYKDYKHGGAMYCWPTGHKFIGKFYLNRKEGYGKQMFPDGATFQGLYHADQRFGPGVGSDPDGCEDVGLWLGEQLLKLCTSLNGFSLKSIPEYAAYMDLANNTECLSQTSTGDPQVDFERDLLPDEVFILPSGIEAYSTDGDHLPLPPGRRRELDRLFYGELWEPDADVHSGYKRDPLSTLPLQSRMQAHIHKHRLQAKNVDWNVTAVLSSNRDSFGPKGLLEVSSELLIQNASRGKLGAMLRILQTRLVHPDVADSRGHTALIAATVNCHDHVIHLLLNMGVDIDKLNCEGMSALAVCHVLYYPFQSLHTTFTKSPTKTQVRFSLNFHFCSVSPPPLADVYKLIAEPNETGTPTDTERPQEEEIEENKEGDEGRREYTETERVEDECDESEVESRGGQTERSGESESKEEKGELIEEEDSELSERVEAKMEEVKEGKEREAGGGQQLNSEDDSEEEVQNKDKDLTREATSGSEFSNSSQVLKTPCSTEVRDRSVNPQTQDTDSGTMKIENHVRLNTLKLLLERGADPNVCRVPMPVLFLAIMAADPEAVRRLLLCGARTDIPLPPVQRSLYPLHVAAALPGPAGPKITELLLNALADPDAQACDQDEIFELDKVTDFIIFSYFSNLLNKSFSLIIIIYFKTNKLLSMTENQPRSEGQTALHVACQRASDFRGASEIVALLLSHGAKTDLLWSGHSPLSLAIATGNDLAVEELLKGGANPNLPLGLGVGSALCALANFKYPSGGDRDHLLDMLAKAGADILMPVKVGEVVGTAVDYAHDSFNQDIRIAKTPFHALSIRERIIFKTRRHLLSMMGNLLRQTARKRQLETKEQEHVKLNRANVMSLNRPLSTCKSLSPDKEQDRYQKFKFCYHCCRSTYVKLTACSQCHKVFSCSMSCKIKAWAEGHKQECVRESGGTRGGPVTNQKTAGPKESPRSTKVQTRNITTADGIQKSVVFKSQGGSTHSTAMRKPKTVSRPLIEELKSPRKLPEPLSVAEVQKSLKENYSYN
ncbi:ankyrin repeat and MYND domain-containing protein 1 isoform X1 [Xyrichtys novacula]|uniref:Ankyrin repeat and MYND domain-containing protein 1 isoform X1 n=1 Tax=Xyrichtys novacula TaxID=13765 RepID=A0AAV1FJC7_XYRNO|nr:ankyrin repeat and MYND domain-containing protein 1 isoform X1 [Xyrichtys novacula]